MRFLSSYIFPGVYKTIVQNQASYESAYFIVRFLIIYPSRIPLNTITLSPKYITFSVKTALTLSVPLGSYDSAKSIILCGLESYDYFTRENLADEGLKWTLDFNTPNLLGITVDDQFMRLSYNILIINNKISTKCQ